MNTTPAGLLCHLRPAFPCAVCPQLLAPTDDAFDQLLTNLGGANGPLPLDALLAQPTLRDILLYHIIPGRYTSGEGF